MTSIRLIVRRLITDWRLMSTVFLGILAATLLMSAAPVYLDALERQSIRSAVDSAVAREGEAYFGITTISNFIPLDSSDLEDAHAAQSEAVAARLAPLTLATRRHLQTPYYAMALPRVPESDLDEAEPPDGDPESERADVGPPVVEGFFQSFDDVAAHLTFVDGRPAEDALLRGTLGPMVEALVSARTAAEFGELRPGDVVVAAPSMDSPLKVSARIVGIVEAKDAEEPYWRNDAETFLFPRIPNAEGQTTETSEPALGMFVSGGALVGAARAAFPGATVDSTWYSDIDSAALSAWSRDEMRSSMDALREELSISLPDAFVFSGIDIMLARFGFDSFLSSVPLLLLMAVMAVAVLYFLFMIVSYLAPNRESDVALFRSRGASGWHLSKLYLGEGAILVLAAAVIAPIPATLAVWLVGFLPYFSHITNGGPLPVSPTWLPFAAAAVSAILCLIVFVVPGVLGARAGLTAQRMMSARPPTMPLVQRYYIDIMFLVVGGALFWELQARGELVSGSLFGQPDVNEALLIAPVLFLMTVGLLFFRIFPMFVRYVSGESPLLVHASAAVTLPALAAAIGIADFQSGDPTGWIPHAALLGGFGAAYWLTATSGGRLSLALWGALQAALALAFFYVRPPDPDAPAFVFIGSVALAALVPAQIVFHLLASLSRRAPAWVSMSMWRMARNPLRYSWLVLLLVLAGGIGVLATTVGATLDRSYEERVRYSVGADVRVSSLQPHVGRRDGSLDRTFGEIAEVESMTIALRGRGRVGAGDGGPGFSYLALEKDGFDAWFREDFAELSLDQALSRLDSGKPLSAIPAPRGTGRLRMWVKPAMFYPLVFLWVVVQDANGRSDTLSFGELDDARWSLMGADVPDGLAQPLSVVSIQINEPGFGAVGTVGEVMFDDLQAVSRASGQTTILEGFEGAMSWLPLPTTAIGTDEIERVSEGAYSGDGAALFTFGKETNNGVRGIYRSGGHGFIPALASSSFVAATGAAVGSGLLVNLPGGIVPVVVRGEVSYFPTMNPSGGGFLIFDIETLLSYVDALSPLGGAAVNELFLNTKPGSGAAVLQEVDRLVRGRGSAMGVEAQLAAQARDPLISAGWRTMALVALGVALFIAALGYIVYLLAFAQRSEGEMGALRSLGFSRAQTVGLVAVEHMTLALVGLGVGAWAGFQMSRITVSAVAVTESGGRALPPFILTTDWMLMGALYAALIAIFAASALTFGKRVFSLDLRRLSRMEE